MLTIGVELLLFYAHFVTYCFELLLECFVLLCAAFPSM